MREKITAIRRNIASLRYNNPSRGMTLVLVAGEYGKTTTAALLKGILTEGGRKAAILPTRYRHSVNGFYSGIARAKKQGFVVVIVEVDKSLLDCGALGGAKIDSLVLTSGVKYMTDLLKLNPQHLVVPTGIDIPAGSVEPYQHITVGEEAMADAQIKSMKLYRKGTELSMVIDHQTKLELATQLVGKANTRDLAIAIAAAYVFGVELSVMQEGVADIEPLEGRFERLELEKKNDCYVDAGGSPESLSDALTSAKQLARKRLIVAISDREVTSEMLSGAKESSDRLLVADYSGEAPSGVEIVKDARTATEKALRAAKHDDFILFYGREFTEIEDDTLKIKEYIGEKA
jgi:UDP-N-acetylmuramoyl-L-alanyl-D-glutamate--2,6-diaminopimelate ligase